MGINHYDTHPLRYLVAQRLGLNDVPDELWDKYIVRQHVILWGAASTSAEKREFQDRLVNWVQEDITAFKKMGGDITPWTTPQKEKRASVEASLSPDDSIGLRAEALCAFWAKLAEASGSVRSF